LPSSSSSSSPPLKDGARDAWSDALSATRTFPSSFDPGKSEQPVVATGARIAASQAEYTS
jgi:hypothetical protein